MPPQAAFIFEKIEQMTTEEAVEILEKIVEEHKDDVNVLDQDEELWVKLINSSNPHETSAVKEKLGAVIHETKFSEESSSSFENEKNRDILKITTRLLIGVYKLD